jgi:nitroimidazol reductase NimA-like FMN-containing flavoprotein (pyridoxamine 5'-phosphate oxidase superfamily)
MTENLTEPNELFDLERGECLRLLARGLVGRVVFTDAALPAAQPVVYQLDDEEIIFRTRNGSKLAAATRHAVVAFEVDDVDVETRSGWSVLGIGQAYEIVDPVRLAELAGAHLDVWVPGHDAHTIAIPLQIITGRRLTSEA